MSIYKFLKNKNTVDKICKNFSDYVESINEPLNSNEFQALNNFCKKLRSLGVFGESVSTTGDRRVRDDTFLGCYPFIGNTKLVKSLNLKNPENTNNRIDFPASNWDYTGNGVKANGDAALDNSHPSGINQIFLYSVLSDETTANYWDFLALFNTNAKHKVVSRRNNEYYVQTNGGHLYTQQNLDAKGIYGYIHRYLEQGETSFSNSITSVIKNDNKVDTKGSRSFGSNKYDFGVNSQNRYGTILKFRTIQLYDRDRKKRILYDANSISKVCNAIKEFDNDLGRLTYSF